MDLITFSEAFHLLSEIYNENPLGFSLGLFLFCACWGSFFNMAAFRLNERFNAPADKSKEAAWKTSVLARSTTPCCDHAIPMYLNIPVMSYLALRGKCHFCGNKIAVRYLATELICGFVGLSSFICTQSFTAVLVALILLLASSIIIELKTPRYL